VFVTLCDKKECDKKECDTTKMKHVETFGPGNKMTNLLTIRTNLVVLTDIVAAIKYCIFYRTSVDDVVNIIKKSKLRINLSDILGTSHVLCENCCELYTPCHVGEWVKYNPELYDAEISIYKDLLNSCSENINIDVSPYSLEEMNTYEHVSEVSPTDRLRQLYTIILS